MIHHLKFGHLYSAARRRYDVGSCHPGPDLHSGRPGRHPARGI